MKLQSGRKAGSRLCVGLLAAAALVAAGGCPVDSSVVLTETVRAALQAMLDTFIETLSAFLAGS